MEFMEENKIVIYQTQDGQTQIDVRLENDTVMLGRTLQSQPVLSTDKTEALFSVVTDYAYALDTLDNYDYERLTINETTQKEPFRATYENAMQAINGLHQSVRLIYIVSMKRVIIN